MFVFQIYLSNDGNMHPIISKRCERIKKFYSECSYKIYKNKEAEDFIKNNFDHEIFEAYNNLVPYAYKADLLRLCLLYIFGGWYFDIGVRLLTKIKISENIDIFAFKDLETKFCLSPVSNAIIFAKEKNQIFMECIKKIVENTKNKFYGQSSLDISGPNVFTRSISQFEDQYTIQYGELRKLTLDLQNKNLAFVGYDGKIYAYFESLRELKIKSPEKFENINNYNENFKNKTIYKS